MNTFNVSSKLLVCGTVAAVTNAILVWGALQATSVLPPERTAVIAQSAAPAPVFSAMVARAASAALVE
ncbi:MAG TPA: hypothetical protein VLV29_07325 [Steroidobacteraceae bacterium]|nr:hypothetical protein [Steroidobacteraceae bacterium]